MTLHKLHLSIFTRKGLFFVAALKSETICLTCKRNTKVILQKLSEFQKKKKKWIFFDAYDLLKYARQLSICRFQHFNVLQNVGLKSFFNIEWTDSKKCVKTLSEKDDTSTDLRRKLQVKMFRTNLLSSQLNITFDSMVVR